MSFFLFVSFLTQIDMNLTDVHRQHIMAVKSLLWCRIKGLTWDETELHIYNTINIKQQQRALQKIATNKNVPFMLNTCVLRQSYAHWTPKFPGSTYLMLTYLSYLTSLFVHVYFSFSLCLTFCLSVYERCLSGSDLAGWQWPLSGSALVYLSVSNYAN